ncbi:hypothetical protein H0A36_03030 [Endozoicomonas sp. SM1973]|uniref:Uncharacterized protein n=1 Tax=Spartinivicinus marinus TaxID=2994442 RepID=A0A853IC56_9GAMM|nr:ABC transporter substrate binding protein [Spartinivicinus marinus]MCX4029391.1 hypothetical protein [Spartinivicinus marinus]NYZ64966.1 hypothetical protein [Spartinivicinus marinus]
MNKLSTYFWYVLKLATVLLCVILSSKLVAGPKDLLIIHSYSRAESNKWVSEQSQGIRSGFANSDYIFHELEMGTKKLPVDQFEAKATEILEQTKTIDPSLIFITDDNALKLMVPKLGKKIPIVFMGVNANIRLDYPWLLEYPNVTGILERPLIKRTIFLMKESLNLKPKKVLLLLGINQTGKAFLKIELNNQKKFKLVSFEVDVKTSGEVEQWKKWIKSSKSDGYDFILATTFLGLTTVEGVKENTEELVKWMSANSSVPVFTVHTDVIGHDKLVGGMVLYGVLFGEAAAKIAHEILDDKKKPKGIPYKTLTQGQLIFSKQQLKKWNLSVDKSFMDEIVLLD